MVIFNGTYKFSVRVETYAFVFFCVTLNNIRRVVGAAVIDDYIFPVLIGLGQDALNAFSEIFLAVIDRGNNTDQWLG